MKLSLVSISVFMSLAIHATAGADSSCGLDEALIGTHAIGSISPRSLIDHTYEYEPPLCELSAFEAPTNTDAPEIMPCNRFMALREDNFKSDYYKLKVFGADGIWVQISSKSGEKRWVQQKSATPTNYPYQHISNDAAAYVNRNIPTQTGIYDEPRLDKPARYKGQQIGIITDDWIDATIPLDFFNREGFKILHKYGVFDPNHIEQGKLATHYGNFLYAGYDVKAIIKDEQGREWLKAEEYLGILGYDLLDLIEKTIEADDQQFSQDESKVIDTIVHGGALRSKAGQTVYFPYREPSGTVTMVMTDGAECD